MAFRFLGSSTPMPKAHFPISVALTSAVCYAKQYNTNIMHYQFLKKNQVYEF